MIKKILLFMFLIMSLVYTSFATIGADVPEECIFQYINETAYEEYKTNNSFRDTFDALIEEQIASNFTINKYFKIKDSDKRIELELQFLADDTSPGGVWGSYYPGLDISYIYSKVIWDYGQSKLYSDTFIKDMIYQTYLHEISHYLDLGYSSGFTDPSYTFNINGTRSAALNNAQFFIDKYNDTTLGPITVPIHLRSALNFSRVFDIYDDDHHYNEVVARISAICLYEVANGNFTYDYSFGSPNYCDEFNFYQDDADNFNIISDTIMQQYFFDAFPEQRRDTILIDEKYCEMHVTTTGVFSVLRNMVVSILSIQPDMIILIIVGLLIFELGLIIFRFREQILKIIK